MPENTFALKGAVCYSQTPNRLAVAEDAYVICKDRQSAGVFSRLPAQYADIDCLDTGGCLIFPGFTDLHLHAPQYAVRGLGMDMELLDWLHTYIFPEEAKYRDLEYAKKAYSLFADALQKSATTRACIFATLHVPATLLLMELLEQTGLITLVGKVNMDRNAIPDLQEADAQSSAEATVVWIQEALRRFINVKPILTPRFIPSCSDALMYRLKDIQRTYRLPVQSHLSENTGEVEWVRQLCPDADNYAHAYGRFGLLGSPDCPTLMAHCVHLSDDEMALLQKQGVYVVHCSQSNTNLASGIAPIRRYLNAGIPVGLGSDMAAGAHLSMFRVMADSIQTSKLYWNLADRSSTPLTVEEVFYLATLGGGSFFGKVGSFAPGYAFDAVIVDDSDILHPQPLTARQRLERLLYLGQDQHVVGKYVNGQKIR